VSYQRRASPLHAARAASACAYCLGLAVAALVLSAPILLVVLVAAVLAAGVGARVGRELVAALRLAVPVGIVIVVLNALVTRDGLTVIARLGDLPVLGHTDITLEATAYGGVLALRAVILILLGALYTAAVDPDRVLVLFRRVSFHSALTATLATRLVPVLTRDARRFAEAQRCRPGRPPTRVQLLRATTASVLDRALDVAAALEVRGYGAARRPPRSRTPYSRHDLAFSAAAIALGLGAVATRVWGVAPFSAYPGLHAPLRAGALICAAALLVVALAPFADRRGIAP
jgi:energy-coupling factor transport system permease protein